MKCPGIIVALHYRLRQGGRERVPEKKAITAEVGVDEGKKPSSRQGGSLSCGALAA